MTERERLIELLESSPHLDTLYHEFEEAADWLIQRNVYVLPCKVGDVIWCVGGDIVENRVSSLTQKADGSWKIRLTSVRYRSVYEITYGDIGNNFFFVREEAEKALAERSKS